MTPNEEKTVYERIKLIAEKKPNHPALICEKHSVTYAQLLQHTNSIAKWMLQKGAVKGDRALIYGKSRIEMVEFMLACSGLGLLAVPINTRLKENEVNHIVEEITPSFLYSDDLSASNLLIKNIKGEMILSAEKNLNSYETIIQLDSALENLPSVSEIDPYLIIYTAAVDGYPKGAVLTHRNMLACNEQTKELFALSDQDCCGVFTPLYHIAGTSILYSGLHLGLPNVILPEFNPKAAVDVIQTHSISIYCSFSPMSQMILDEADKENVNIEKHVRKVFGLDTKEVIQNYLDKNIDWYGIYAQTEVTGVIAAEKYQNPSNEIGLIGSPGATTKITLVNEHGEETTEGETGEICVVGETVFSYYWNRPGETEWTFRGGMLHTGDLAARDIEGKLWFKGRKTEKELIKTGGENVYPLEVEQVIKKHPLVENVVVFGVPDEKWLEAVKAVIEIKGNNSLSDQELKVFCKDQIASYKIPKYIEFIEEMPRIKKVVDREKIKKIYS